MSAPTFEATDQGDLLALLADEHRVPGASAVEAFLAACEADARDHDGIVSVNRVRALLDDQDIEHHRYSAFWSHFTGRDRAMRKATTADVEHPWETCEGSKSGNNGRPYRLRVWVGQPEQQEVPC